MREIVLGPAAESDLAEARAWYEEKLPGLGTTFFDAIETTLERVAGNPEIHPIVLGDVRKTLVSRFPYAIYYRVRPSQIRVLGEIHQHRDPRVWQRRISRQK